MKKNVLLFVGLFLMVAGFGQDIETGLIARYSFCGNLNDMSDNDNDGIYMGANGPTYTADVNGNQNSAMFFNGFSDWVKIPSSETVNSPEGGATVACWVYYQSLAFGQWVPICAKTDSPNIINRQYSLGINHSTGQIYWHTTYVATAPLELNTWYHIAVTYTPELLKCYLNGEFIGEVEPNDPISQNEEPFEIGRDTPQSTDYFNGVMDEMNVYGRALSATDVLALKNYDGCSTASVKTNNWKGDVEVYPNPVVSKLMVSFSEAANERTVRLFNSVGQMVYENQYTDKRIEIDMSNMLSGVYFLYLQSEEGLYTEKVMK